MPVGLFTTVAFQFKGATRRETAKVQFNVKRVVRWVANNSIGDMCLYSDAGIFRRFLYSDLAARRSDLSCMKSDTG